MNEKNEKNENNRVINENERLDRVNENIVLVQRRDGLTFGTDAYLLYAYMKSQRSAHALELGAGTGIISLLCLSKDKFANITAVEIQKSFAELVAENARINSLSHRLKSVCADLRDLKSADVGGKLFDVVFANPPYMQRESGAHNQNDEKNIARREMCGDIGDFCAGAKRLLRFGGSFYVVYRADRMTDLFSAMRQNKIEPKRLTLVHADAHSAPTLLLCEGRYGGAHGLFVTRPLIMHKDASAEKLENTPELDYIYEKGEFDESFVRK